MNNNNLEKILRTQSINSARLQNSIQPFIDFQNSMTNTMKPIIDSFILIQNQVKSILERTDIKKAISESLNILNSIDFDSFFRRFDEGRKKSLSIMIEYDWYIPFHYLDSFEYSFLITEKYEADEFVDIFLDELTEKNLSIYDLIPKSLNNYEEVEKLKNLVQWNYKKLAVIHCLERIENILTNIQHDKLLSELKISNRSYNELVNRVEKSDDLVEEVLINLTNIGTSIRLFDRFAVVGEELKNENIVLNRNLFMHGLVEEKQVTDKIVKQAIFAWAFFATLAKVLGNKRKRRVGISKKNQLNKIGYS